MISPASVMGESSKAQASCCIIIPARFGSSRFPGKPLARLRGANGQERSLIEWTWLAAHAVPDICQLVVATDDRRIADEVRRFGGEAVMTPSDCLNGTERCAAALGELRQVPEVVVNLQGDAPLTPPAMVTALLHRLAVEPDLAMVTAAIRCTDAIRRHLEADRAAGRVGGTTALFNRRNHALYFSKEVLPFSPPESESRPEVHLHVGLYAYSSAALTAYARSEPSPLELSEGLEQLRFLSEGLPVGVEVCAPPDGLLIELNNPADLPLIEAELERRAA
jgi:3-deoxy-manno-octulosonate cytidylyltransferase (CMP-KDO synthetase)